MSVFDRFGVFPAVASLALAPALPEGLAQPAPAAGIGGATVTVGALSTDEERVACQFAIRAVNNIGEDVRILFSESVMVPGPVLRNSDHFETMSDRWLSPGERLDVRYEVGGRCGASRNWYMVVRIGPRGGEAIRIVRRTDDPSDRTIHLGEAACWASARSAPDLPHADRTVDSNDEAAGCDPETTRYGPVPAEETDDPAAASPAEEVDVDQLQGNWVRVESNNPRNDGIRIRVEGGRATITAMPPRGSDRFRVGQVVWDDLSADASLGVRGSDGASYPSLLTMEGTNRLHIDVDRENSPGNVQTWERAGPSIDGDWVLYYTLKEYEQNRGIRVRVEGDRATIRYVPPTADRGFRVGDVIWREFSPSDHSSAALYLFEGLFGGSTYEPARMSRSTRYEDGGIRSIRVSKTDTRTQLWGRPEKAEEVFAEGIGEDEEEGALLDLPHEPLDDPSAPDEDLELPDDLPTVDIPEGETRPAPACLSTSLPHDGTGITWDWGLSSPTNDDPREQALGIWEHTAHDFESEMSFRNRSGPTEIERSRIPGFEDGFAFVWQRMGSASAGDTASDLTAAEYDQRSEAALNDGRRPIDIEVYGTSAEVRFAGIWTRNPEDVAWHARHDLTGTAFGQTVENLRDLGYRLIDMEAYPTPNDIRYAGIWYRSCDSSNWDYEYGIPDQDTYQETVEDFQARGFRVIDFESYRTSEGQQYAAVFEKPSSPRAWRVRSGRSLKGFLNYHHRYVDQGFRLIDYESYETDDGIRYAGVWGANDARYDFPFRATLDDSIQAYRTRHAIPGMSVVVMQDGDVIYRRGFGWADSAQAKWAHSGTIYLTASIAKVIGATLAARLEQQGRLDLSDTTANILDYVDSTWHKHTVEQLLSKTGCVWHYDEGPEPEEKYYRWREPALRQIQDSGLLSRCVPDMYYHYSTHGFTFVGGVLEEVLGEDIVAILTNELTRPFQLTSMDRVGAFPVSDAAGPVPYYHLAQGYRFDSTTVQSVTTSYEDSSWKVLGGGLQVDAIDLARFGWLTLDGTLVSDSVRDNRLWMSRTGGLDSWSDFSSAPAVGLGWVLRNVSAGGRTRRVAEHGGAARGARSQLQVYRDDGVVIAILTNQRNGVLTPGPDNPRSHPIRDFADTVADVVFTNPPPR